MEPAQTWRTQFRAVRLRTVVREVVAAAAGGAVLLALTAPGAALVWSVVLVVALPATIAAFGGYRWRVLGEGVIEQRAVARAGTCVVVVLVTAGYVAGDAVPVAVVAASVPVALGLVVAGRAVQGRSILARRAGGAAMLRTLIVGPGPAMRDLVSQVRRAPGAGYDVIGWCGDPDEPGGTTLGVPRLGSDEAVASVADLVGRERVDVVMLVGSHETSVVRRMAHGLAAVGAGLVVAPPVAEVASSRVRIRPTGDLWSILLDVEPRRPAVAGKAVIDRVLGAALLAVASAVLVPVMAAVRLTSPGPALFRQERIGKDGRPFTMWKVRTMYVGSDDRRTELLPQDEGNGLLFKVRHDPRITPIGHLLRRTSLDELPQLVNVVRGEMSLVGPRPALPCKVARYCDDERGRLAVKPGLTGLWQVGGRSDLNREDAMRLDLRYVENWFLALDFRILWRTVAAVVGGRGAY